jgi:hypothetical protein
MKLELQRFTGELSNQNYLLQYRNG